MGRNPEIFSTSLHQGRALFVHLLFHAFFAEMIFLAAHAGGHQSGCPHRAGLILSKKEKNIKDRLPKKPRTDRAKYQEVNTYRYYRFFKQWFNVERTISVRVPQVRGARRGARGAAERAASGARAAPPREAAGRSSLWGRRRRAGGVLVGLVRRLDRVREPRVRQGPTGMRVRDVQLASSLLPFWQA